MYKSEFLTKKDKWKFILILYLCLISIFIGAISEEEGMFALFAFVISLVLLCSITKSVMNIPFLIAAMLPNTKLLKGYFSVLSIQRIILILSIIFIIYFMLKKHRPLKLLVPAWFYILWFFYIAINLLFINNDGGIQSVITILYMILLSIMLQRCVLQNEYNSEKFLISISVGISFIIIIAFFELALGRTFFYSLWTGAERYRNGIMRVGSTVADPNNICFFLVPFVFVLETSVMKRVLPSTFRYFVKYMSILLVVLTSSRTGLVALVVGYAICILAKRRSYMLLSIPIIGFSMNYIFQIVENLLLRYSDSTNFRNLIVKQSLNLWEKNKLFGVGPNNIIPSLGYDSDILNTMNTYIYMLVGLGIIGLLFYIFYWYFLVKRDVITWIKIKKPNDDVILRLSAIVTSLIIVYTLDTFYMMLMWYMPAVICALNFLEKSRRQKRF